MEKNKPERLTLPHVDDLKQMLRLANDLHALPPARRAVAALCGMADLIKADILAAWSGPADRPAEVAIVTRPAGATAPHQSHLLPRGIGPLIGRHAALSPVVLLHTDPATRTHEIHSVCRGPGGPSLLIARRADRPFDQPQRSIVHLLHPQTEWALRHTPPSAQPVELSPKHQVVLDLLLTGESEKQIAARLKHNTHTIHSRIKYIYRRYGVSSRPQLLAKFVGTGRGGD